MIRFLNNYAFTIFSLAIFIFVLNIINESSKRINCQETYNVSKCVKIFVPNTEEDLIDKYKRYNDER